MKIEKAKDENLKEYFEWFQNYIKFKSFKGLTFGKKFKYIISYVPLAVIYGFLKVLMRAGKVKL